MKIFVILLTTLLLSCSNFTQDCYIYEWYFPEEIPRYEGVSDLGSVMLWMYKNMSYIEDKESEWLLPDETYNNGGGDCEDLAGLLYVIYTQCFDMSACFVEWYNGYSYHMTVFVNGEYRNNLGTKFNPIGWKEVNKYTYVQFCNIAEKY